MALHRLGSSPSLGLVLDHRTPLVAAVDPVLVRLAFVGAGFLTGIVPGLLAYLVGWIIVPLEPLPLPTQQTAKAQPNGG